MVTGYLKAGSRKRRMVGGKEKESTRKKKCNSPVVCVLFMWVRYSTHTNIKSLVKHHCYDVDKTVYFGLISGNTKKYGTQKVSSY